MFKTGVIVFALTIGTAASADILELPSGGFGVTQGVEVQRGASQEVVLQQFGEPVQRHGAVGVPAISSWQYPKFRVYFENGLVLHTVFSASGPLGK